MPAYEDRVKAMRSEVRRATLRNFDVLKASPRWLALSEVVRVEIEKNATLLRAAEDASDDLIQVAP